MAKKSAKPRKPAPLFETLEPRLLLSAEGLGAMVADAGLSDDLELPQRPAEMALLQVDDSSDQAEGAALSRSRELIFVDPASPDAEELVSHLLSAADEVRSLEIITLQAGRDGIEQISEALAGRQDLVALHIISHGTEGALQLGSTRLEADTIGDYEQTMRGWRTALSEDADILLYGCDLAAAQSGQAIIHTIARLTGADIGASTDPTGHISLGGDWDLEYQAGIVDTKLALSPGLQGEWTGLLALATFQADGTYTGTRDNHIDANNPTQAEGTSANVLARTAPDIQGLLRFDNIFGNGPGQIPYGATINSATLTIEVAGVSSAGANVTFHRMLVPWGEADSWNSLGGGVQIDGSQALATTDAAVPSPELSGAKTLTGPDLNATLQAWSDGDTNHGWVVQSDDSTALSFYSSEEGLASRRPQLNVDYTAGASVVANDDSSYAVDEDGSLTVDWWDSAWTKRRQLSFDTVAQTTTDLSDFPVLVKLTNGVNIDYAQTQDGGQDLRFFDADGTPLVYEIEEWNELGDSYVWVRVSQVDANSNTDAIWMYYGNNMAAAGEDPEAVWSSGYQGVWHLHDDFLDATNNSNDGTNFGSSDTPSPLADGQDFNGAGDYVQTTSNGLQTANDFTISLWFNADATNYLRNMVWQGQATGNGVGDPGYEQEMQISLGNYLSGTGATDDVVAFFLGDIDEAADGDVLSVSTPFSDLAGWHYVVATVSDLSGTPRADLYLDGNWVDSDTGTTARTQRDNWDTDLRFGRPGASTRYFDGSMDEVRIASGARSSDWVKAQYLSTNDSLITFGGEQTVSGLSGVLANDTDDLAVTALSVGPIGSQITLASGARLAVYADGSFAYETNGAFEFLDQNDTTTETFTYDASDGSNTDTATVTITVNGVNDAPTDLSVDNLSVAENAAGAVIGNVTVTDVDADDTHGVVVDDVRFEVVGGQLRLKAGQSLDHETEATLGITITATDSQGAPYAEGFTVTVTDMDEIAPVVTVNPLTTGDNTPALSGTVSADTTSVQVTVDGNTYAALIAGSGWSIADNTIAPALADGTYDVAVTATDGVGNTGNDATINELTVDTTGPTVTVNAFTTGDSTPALSGNVSADATSVQITVDANTYAALIAGSGWSIAANTIAPALADGTYDVAVTATDGVGNTGNDATIGELTVNTALPNGPPSIANASFTLAQNTAGGIVVGTLSASDPDVGDTLTFGIVSGNTGGAFTIEPATGELSVADPSALASGVSTGFNLTVQVQDSGAPVLSDTATVTIQVNSAPAVAPPPVEPPPVEPPPVEPPPVEPPPVEPPPVEPPPVIEPPLVVEPPPVIDPEPRPHTGDPDDEPEEQTRSPAGGGTAQPNTPTESAVFFGEGQPPAASPLTGVDELRYGDRDRSRPSLTDRPDLDDAPPPVQLQQVVAAAEQIKLPEMQQPALWGALDMMAAQMNDAEEWHEQERERQVTLQATTSVTFALSAGFVTWLLRAGTLATSLLSSMPLWRGFDPLPVVGFTAREHKRLKAAAERLHKDKTQAHSDVERLFDRASESASKPKKKALRKGRLKGE